MFKTDSSPRLTGAKMECWDGLVQTGHWRHFVGNMMLVLGS